MARPQLIVVGGATATGKTALSIQLAQHFGTEILSADSRQFYREMNIGTAKPTPEELAAAPHHFVNSLSIHDDYSVGDFGRDGLALLERLFAQHDKVILTGGSGLFIQALCEGLDHFPEVLPEHRAVVAEGETTGELAWLQAQVAARDPVYFAQVDRQNPARLRRALEVITASGQPYSSFLGKAKAQRPFDCQYILLEWPREQLYARIDQRVDAMIAHGLEEEARSLWPHKDRPALRTVGYEEWFTHFEGAYTREETIEKIKQHSRNYAKRQITWFRKHGMWTPFSPSQVADIVRWCTA